MVYYVNNKIVNYDVLKYYLIKSIKYQTNFSLSDKEVNDIYYGYYNDMKSNGVELLFKDKMSYKIGVNKKWLSLVKT